MHVLLLPFMAPEFILVYLFALVVLLIIIGLAYIFIKYRNKLWHSMKKTYLHIFSKLQILYEYKILPQYKIVEKDGKFYPMYRCHTISFNGYDLSKSHKKWDNYKNDLQDIVVYKDLITAKYFLQSEKKEKKTKYKNHYMW